MWTSLSLLLSLSLSVYAGHLSPIKSHHRQLARRFDQFDPKYLPDDTFYRSTETRKKRSSQKCSAPQPSSSPVSASAPAATSIQPTNVNNVAAAPSSSPSPVSSSSGGSRLNQIKNMYAFSGYVYSIESCPSKSAATSAFKQMKSTGARNVLTFGYCQGQDSKSYYSSIINAASDAGIKIMPLVATLITDGGSISSEVVPRMNNVVQAIISNPDPVLAIALGDEPLFDNDFGSASSLSNHVDDIRGQFKSAGLDIPISISDMAYGWQTADDSGRKQLANNLDFFMINNFPYFAGNAGWGGADSAWNSFTHDVSYMQSIANGKPLLVTQTGWASNRNEFAPNSNAISVSTASSQAYWDLLDGHCSDYFKKNSMGWMWRDWDDTISGWGVLDASGNYKWQPNAKTSC